MLYSLNYSLARTTNYQSNASLHLTLSTSPAHPVAHPEVARELLARLKAHFAAGRSSQ